MDTLRVRRQGNFFFSDHTCQQGGLRFLANPCMADGAPVRVVSNIVDFRVQFDLKFVISSRQ